MANTFTQCYVHLVFSPKNREALILNDWKDDLEKYITHTTNSRKHRLLSINAPRDHIHILIGYYLSDSIPNLVEDLKSSSTKWINNNGLTPKKFAWQHGYGAFTYSRSQINNVIEYINNQEEHHRKRSFKEEFKEILLKNGIEYDEKYLFDFFEKDND